MKKATNVLLLWLFLLFAWNATAQVSGYTFTQSTGTYTAITGGTVVANSIPGTGTTYLDDVLFTGQTIPFSFGFNGSSYTTYALNTNGVISFGVTTLTSTTYSHLSATTAYDGAMSPFARDMDGRYVFQATTTSGSNVLTAVSHFAGLIVGEEVTATNIPAGATITAIDQGAGTVTVSANATATGTLQTIVAYTAQIMSKTEGAAPNRVHIIQFKNFKRYGSGTYFGELYNFQIRLYETTNKIEFVYGNNVGHATSTTGQVGIRGLTNADYIARTTATNWNATTAATSNAATCTFSNTVYPAAGLTFTFTPPAAGSAPNCANIVAPLDGAINVAANTTLSWVSGGGLPDGYKVYFGTNNPPTNIVNGTTQTGTIYTPASPLLYSTTYYWKIVPYNTFGDATGCSVWSFTTMADPTISAFPWLENFEGTTYPPLGWNFAGGTQNWAKYTSTTPVNSSSYANFWGWTNPNNALMITPPLNTTSLNAPGLFFKWSHLYSSTYPLDALEVFVSNNGGSTWTSIWYKAGADLNSNDGAGNTAPGTFVEAFVDLSPYNTSKGTLLIKFNGISGYGPNLYVDDVQVKNVAFGTLDGYVYKFGTTTPIEGATVTCGTNSSTTNAAGFYTIGNILAGTYNVTASATGYASQTVNGVSINAGQTTSQNFGLTWAQIGVNPSSFTETLEPNTTLSKTLTISNTGTGNLDYLIYFSEATDNSGGNQTPQLNKQENVSTNALRPDASLSGTNKPVVTDVYTTCPSGSIFSQEPNIASWSVATSEAEPGYSVHQYFSGVTGPIGGITFWGGNLVYSGAWAGCDTEDPMNFIIKFYTDNAGLPGTEVASFSPTITRVSTEVALGTYGFLYMYQYTFPSNVNLPNGWVSIQGQTATPNCWFMWSATSATGATFYKQWNNATSTYTTGTYGCAMCFAAGSSWLGLNPSGSGTVAPGGTKDISVLFNSTGLENITKTGNIVISSNSQTSKTTTTIPVTMVVTAALTPPDMPSDPNPANNATMVPFKPLLSWTNGARTSTVKVVVTTSTFPPIVVEESAFFSGNSYQMTVALNPKTLYRWRVTASNGAGNTLGPQWSFTTIGKGTIAGTITDAFTGLPIEGATVTVNSPAKYSGVTAANGTYSIPDILEGSYTVSAAHPDYVAPAPATGVVVTHNATTTVNFQMDLYLVPPTGLTAQIQNNYNVHLTWKAPGAFDPTWLHWDDGTNANSIGTGAAADFDVAIRFTPDQLTDYTGGSLTKIKFFPVVDGSLCTYTLKIWTGSTPTLVYSQPLAGVTVSTWNEVVLNTPVPFNTSEELWIGYNCNTTTGYPAGCDAGPAIVNYGDMIYFGGAWGSMYTLYALNYNWNIQGWVESVKGTSVLEPVAEQKSPVTNTGTLIAVASPNPVSTVSEPGKAPKSFSGFNVYRDNVAIATNIPDAMYDDNDLVPGTYSYEVSAVYPSGESAKAGPLSVTILLGGYVEGYVYDAFDNSPIEGAVVETLLADYSTTTNALGYYHMALPVGSWDIAASATGYESLYSYGIQILANETTFNDYGLTLAAPVITDVYQDGMYAVVLWDGNPLYDNAKDKSNVTLLTTDIMPATVKDNSGKPKYVPPTGTKQGGDVIATAVAIPSLPYTLSGTTTGYTDDYDASCPYTSPGGPDVVYSLTPDADHALDISLCNSFYDTKLYILASDGTTLLGCNDDLCGDDGYKSAILNFAVTAGTTYYIIVDGYDDTSFGEYTLELTEYVACDIDCSPNATAEDEVCAGDGYVDNYNGGCNSVPPVFSYISSGQTICGTSSTYLQDGSIQRRDTDWYLYTTDVPQSVTFSGVAEFPLQLLLVTDAGDCTTGVPTYAQAAPCAIASFTYTIMPGTYYFWVGPSVFTGVPCGETGNQYEVTLTTVDIFMPHYNVFKDQTLLTTTYNTYFVDPDINLGSTYCYQVSEVLTEAGRETGLSNSMCVSIVCPVPVEPYAVVSGTSADLFWTPMGFEANWNIEWGVSGFTQGTGTLVPVTAIPYTLTGLTQGVTYAFYVQADCGSGYASAWAGPAEFTVPCDAATLPYTMDFTGVATGALPACWSVSGLGLTNWSVQATANAGGVSPEMRLNWSPSFTGESMLVSQPINTTGYTTLSMTFKHFLDWYSNSVILGVKTSADGVTWNEVWSVVAAANVGPEDVSITLNNTDVGSPTFQVAFFINGYTFDIDYWYIDNINITAPITCPAPTLLTATDITQNSATLGWTPGGSETFWNLEYGPAGFTPGTGTPAFANLNPTYPLTGLDASTAYSFYVQAVCGEGDNSFWSGPYTFNTACGAFDVPFAEGFEGAFPPTCWTNTGWEQSLYGGSHSGLEWAYSNLLGSELTTPVISIPSAGAYQLGFWYRAESASYPQDFDVLISNDGGANWTLLQSFVGVINIVYEQAFFNLTAYAGQNVSIKFVGQYGEGGYDYGVCVDDVLIDLIPPPQQTMMLPLGWSGWSSYIDPAMDATFAEVIAPVAPYMDFGQYFGSVYWPAYGINTMGNFTNAHGYVAKMYTAAELTLTGNLMAPGTLNLNSGWNLISVLSECNVDVTLLGGLPDFVICMEVAGAGVYWPAGGITTLTTLVPGKAYWVKMNAAASFTFPACAKDAGATGQLPLRPEFATPWNTVNYTGTTHFVAISEEAGRSLATGDVIGVFNAEGICTGMTQYQGRATTLNVFGDDVTTATPDGMTEGSAMTFRVYRASTGEVFDVTVNYGMDMPDYTGTFTTLGMSRIIGMTLNATGVGTLTNGVSIFPNPSTGIFNITLTGVTGNVDITVVDAQGQTVANTHTNGNTVIDLSAQPRGIYYVKLVGSNFTRIEKVVVK